MLVEQLSQTAATVMRAANLTGVGGLLRARSVGLTAFGTQRALNPFLHFPNGSNPKPATSQLPRRVVRYANFGPTVLRCFKKKDGGHRRWRVSSLELRVEDGAQRTACPADSG